MRLQSTLFCLLFLSFYACQKNEDGLNLEALEYRQAMRDFVIGISNVAKTENPNFLIIPQNGIELITNDGEDNGPINLAFLNAIDGHCQEDLYYGYDSDNQATSNNDNAYLRGFLNISKGNGKQILVTDYCSSTGKMDDSYAKNNTQGYISFADNHRELDNIPTYPTSIIRENNARIQELSSIKNFLYLINPDGFQTKASFINAVTATNYDLLIMDLFFHDGQAFTSEEIIQLKSKANRGTRLVICYMSIGEAEDYRYYWNSTWQNNKPSWLEAENRDWPGNYKVKYWDSAWQEIIFGNNDSYLNKILNTHFDGVYLNIIDAFGYFE
jgi:cysteinyl-tRNA synthetase